MASDVVYDAVKNFLVSNWTTTLMAYENEPLADHLLQNADGSPIACWVAMEMTGNLYSQETIGAGFQEDNRWDEEGKLWFHIFVPVGSGSSVARRNAKLLADLFRGLRLLGDETLEFMDASLGLGEAADDNGNWYGVSMSIDWRRWEA